MTNQQAIDLLSNTYFPCGSDSGAAIAKAIEALKAQEPRVMTIYEVARCSFCWVEDDEYLFPALFIGMEKRANGQKCNVFLGERPDSEDCEFWYDLDSYNQRYIGCRCWSSRPTDEQREAEPWLD